MNLNINYSGHRELIESKVYFSVNSVSSLWSLPARTERYVRVGGKKTNQTIS